MGNYKRNVTYFYQYHNGRIGTTTGFLKLEVKGDTVGITINIQETLGVHRSNPTLCFYHEALDNLSTVKICEIERCGEVLTFQTKTSWEKMFDTGRDLYSFDGVIVFYSQNDYYLGDFKDRDRSSYNLIFKEENKDRVEQSGESERLPKEEWQGGKERPQREEQQGESKKLTKEGQRGELGRLQREGQQGGTEKPQREGQQGDPEKLRKVEWLGEPERLQEEQQSGTERPQREGQQGEPERLRNEEQRSESEKLRKEEQRGESEKLRNEEQCGESERLQIEGQRREPERIQNGNRAVPIKEVTADKSSGNTINDSFKTMIKEYPKLSMGGAQELFDCVRINLRDIGKLDISNWKLGVNSFLTHGYYTYKYLMLGNLRFDNGKKQAVLGVPGVFTNREKYLANMFGFYQFIPVRKNGMKTGQFGYWIVELAINDDRY